MFINSFIYQKAVQPTSYIHFHILPYNFIFIHLSGIHTFQPYIHQFIHLSWIPTESISPTLYSFKRMRHNWYLVTSLRFRNNYSKSNFLGLRAKISTNTNLSWIWHTGRRVDLRESGHTMRRVDLRESGHTERRVYLRGPINQIIWQLPCRTWSNDLSMTTLNMISALLFTSPWDQY